ncbi:MAG: DUF835 domain-containing protein [Candidatus Thermoplasmatota archaeon]|nr:DUF835 domain-containing protein [Candidatus Thermoplasmatota archaeon]
MDPILFVFEVLPVLLGLLVAGFVAVRAYRNRAQFFKVVRGLVLVLAVAALVVLLCSELAASLSSGEFEDSNDLIGVVFVVFMIWLSTVLVSLIALYPGLTSRADFMSWFRREPANFITLWGLTGAATLILWYAGTEHIGRESLATDRLLLVIAAYLMISMAFDLLAPVLATMRGTLRHLSREGKLNMMLLATAWMGIPAAEFALDIVPEKVLNFHDANPYSWVILVLFIVIARSVQSAGFLGLVVSPETETLRRDGFRAFDIPRGVYLICDSRPDLTFSLFSELCTLPLRPDAKLPPEEGSAKATLEFLIPNGLVVTREFPDNVRLKYNLQVTPTMWLTETPGDRKIAPTSLTVLTDTMTRFMEANLNSIVLLEGVEYLVTHNGFRKVLKLLDALNETAWISRARLLVTIDPKAFDTKDLALLERDRTVVRGAEGIEELKRESMVAAAFE